MPTIAEDSPPGDTVRIEEMKTRIKLSFPAHLPHADALGRIIARLCAQGP
jgi:hypothetical protein